MSKGSGLGKGVSAASKVRGIISRLGGLTGGRVSLPGEAGMGTGSWAATKAQLSQHYAGTKTRADATRRASRVTPVEVAAERRGNSWHVSLTDGRHRLAAAKAAGATHVPARVRVLDRQGYAQIIRTRVKI